MHQYTCPLSAYEPWAGDVIHLYGLLQENGLLPDRGGVLDQSAWFLDAVRVVKSEIAAGRGE